MAEAQAAIDSASGSTLLEQEIQCDYAFVRPPSSGPRKGRAGRDRYAEKTRHGIQCFSGSSIVCVCGKPPSSA